ncbi:MAG: ABC transporter permease [Magnetovibrio sp.]|nr:ABC transporter permease [Magnetovibrio sp.]
MSGWPKRLWIVFTKEIRDHARDQRSLTLALIYPLLGPLLVASGLYMAGKTLNTDYRERPLDVPAVGLENAPALAAHFKKHNINIVAAPQDEQARKVEVREGRLPVILVVPKRAQGSENYTVELITNLGRADNLRATARLADVIARYNEIIGSSRAKAAGLPGDYAAPIKMKKINVARDANIAVFFYNMMPPLIIFMIFLGGVHLSIDTTVGERERGALEPLLLAPVERWVLLLAKAGAALAFTVVTTLVNVGAFKTFMGLAAGSAEQLTQPPGWAVFAIIVLISMPLMAIAVALQMSIAVITRSMKEAQIYLGLLPLIPALPGMVLVFQPINPSDLIMTLPVFGQMVLIGQLVAEQSLDPRHIIIATCSTLGAAALIFMVAARWFRREKMFVLG